MTRVVIGVGTKFPNIFCVGKLSRTFLH